MYETEANLVQISGSEIPGQILERFAESRKTVTWRTLIPWSEHCTECVWPTCYTSCDLYTPRADGRCRRFVEGMVRIACPDSVNSYLLKISFKRWAKLWSEANLEVYPLLAADREERRDFLIARVIGSAPGPINRILTHKRYSLKKRWMRRKVTADVQPNCLMVECYNPGPVQISMTATVRRDDVPVPFQALLRMEPGFNRHRVPVAEIERLIDLSTQFHIELTPNEILDGATLYFGAMDFVKDRAFQPLPAPKLSSAGTRICKCVVWDLDNTLWDGVLTEDGPGKLRLKQGILHILQQLDDRGILNSIASKNHPEEALGVLRHFGIDQYFLFPQISWEPKSQGIQKIAASLNIGTDSLLFVDDSRFEREEVMSVCSEVMVVDALEYQNLVDRPDCQLPVTEESRGRRLFYRDQENRQNAQKDFSGEYTAFLKNCNLRLTIRPLCEENFERVHELTQRTNQMNFSGNRYSRCHLQDLLKHSNVDAYVLDCDDQFGSYGTIGFCVVNRAEARMTDLMFSCRVQGKRVEHGFMSYLIQRYRKTGRANLLVDYRRTKKNSVSGKVFDDLGFQTLGECDGLTHLVFPETVPLPDESIITIVDTTLQAPVLEPK